MSNFNLQSFADRSEQGSSDAGTGVGEATHDVTPPSESENNKSSPEEGTAAAARVAVGFALTAIKQGNGSRWTMSGSGLADPLTYMMPSSVSSRAKASAGSTESRGDGVIKFLTTLLGEAESVNKKFNPLFDLVKSMGDDKNAKKLLVAPPAKWIEEILSGWELVHDYKSWYGEESVYDFVAGRSDSLLDKFKDSWSNINRFRETDLFDDIFDLFSQSRGSLDTGRSNVEDFLQSILLWRAVLRAMKMVIDGSIVVKTEEPVATNKDPEEKLEELRMSNLNIQLSSVRSANNAASVDRATKNIMIDRSRLSSGEQVILVFYFDGPDSKKLSKSDKDYAMSVLMEYIDIADYLDGYKIGEVIGLEHIDKKTKLYLELDRTLLKDLIEKFDDIYELFKIKYREGYLKVEACNLDLYNKIKKIANSTTTSYYTVTTPSGKKTDLSIADIVMGRGYSSGLGNKFKAKSLSKKVLKKNKK